jgi:hypothetical protein
MQTQNLWSTRCQVGSGMEMDVTVPANVEKSLQNTSTCLGNIWEWGVFGYGTMEWNQE